MGRRHLPKRRRIFDPFGLSVGDGRFLSTEPILRGIATVLERVACRRYIISTDGSIHRHPDSLTLLRILRYSRIRPCLMFNYETAATARWRDRRQDILDQFPEAYYDTAYPERPDQGILVEWSDDSGKPEP